jgi:ribonuclease Z
MRRDVDGEVPQRRHRVVTHEIDQGIVLEANGVKVTAFLVDHAPIEPAFGCRIDYASHSVVLSGDTRVSENLVRFADGADVLIHETFDATGVRRRSTNPTMTEAVITHNTLPVEAGRIFNRVKPKRAVYSHAPASQTVLDETRAVYSGRLEGVEDLLAIDIGNDVSVRHFGR